MTHSFFPGLEVQDQLIHQVNGTPTFNLANGEQAPAAVNVAANLNGGQYVTGVKAAIMPQLGGGNALCIWQDQAADPMVLDTDAGTFTAEPATTIHVDGVPFVTAP